MPYTQACFAALHTNAGCDFHHYIFDNGSTDGTLDWLKHHYSHQHFGGCIYDDHNLGIHRAMNVLLDALKDEGYDLLVKIDNDCEVVTPGTLRAVAEHVLENPDQPRVVSPLILGLRNRPHIHRVEDGVGYTHAIGGIFMPIPPSFLRDGFRYDEQAPIWGGDDERIGAMAHEVGGYTAYLMDYEARHYKTTDGQAEDIPAYFERRVLEGGPAR